MASRLITKEFVLGFASVFLLIAGLFGLAVMFIGARDRPAAVTGNTFTCTVTGVHDGDGPIYCREGPSVRLSALAAREMDGSCNANQPCPAASAIVARDALRQLAMGHVLQCRRVGTSYSRVVAWCAREDGIDLSCAMIGTGTALRWPRYDPPGILTRC